MPDESQKPPFPGFVVSRPPEGPARHYANIAHIVWTGADITVQMYQIVQPNREILSESQLPTELFHSSSVTFTWASAKMFHKHLGEVLDRYEKAYGPIVTEFKEI